ncbi:hypothetical protein [Enterococcus sp. AZ192]|uniref:hypothetical protein n=1 Tax=unclassified Enterococcus TaxID=2608891 RepID=UPI003D2B88A0
MSSTDWFNKITTFDFSKLNIQEYLFILIFFLAILLFLFITLIIIDYFRNYDSEKLKMKITKRSGSKSIGGGQEYFLRYWVWQRKKRKKLCYILASMTFDHMYYPKEKWVRKGMVKFPLRREVWINVSDVKR